jgi:hypothetical protein
MMDDVKIYASDFASGRPDDTAAVIATYGQLIAKMSIAQARDIANRLAIAADDAELKLEQHS